ncbi:superoxide dismutase family protein [Halobacillus sp. Marseille-Q1614]|uniref:superoxide dismutase family protein n=1 Tax=Halobacillus sp. Marseille-Q1614 TaxID=2709134 RepID=UPI00156EC3CE|nr:superoxide dismutase family protein [Halobacillus sp. Marseille-Q1614]
MKLWIVFVVCAGFLIGCSGDKRSPLESPIYNVDGDRIGTVTLTEEAQGVGVKIKAEGLEPGPHAVHFHERPECNGPDFQSAGNHFNPKKADHGLMNEKGAHTGDLPNVEADESGKTDVELTLSEATLRDGQTSLLRDKGTSFVIHSRQDDGMTQPAGDSGERIACAEITVKANEDPTTDPTEADKNKE